MPISTHVINNTADSLSATTGKKYYLKKNKGYPCARRKKEKRSMGREVRWERKGS